MTQSTSVNAAPTQYIIQLQKLRGAPARLAAVVRSMPESAHGWQLEPDSWSVGQTAAHLAACEAIFLARLQRILGEDNPWLGSFGPETARPDFDEPLDAILKRFMAGRQRLLDFLAERSPTDWERPAMSESRGASTLALEVQVVVNHDAEHLGQVQAVYEAWQSVARS